MTRQRAAIEKQLSETDQFRSAQQLHDDLRDAGHVIGLATVYRTLQSMANDKEVDVARNDDGEAMYRRCIAFEHHHHLICRNCNKTVEIASEEIEQWVRSVADHYGYTDVEHIADLTGLCQDCSK
ncbi:transcriptional repressor [Boudabousia liubingyangii]|uniref:Transcriptional repressor n=1 Tax=Boudabousia liubingyangii TaxID=1921764 RepID=A0A1Q5PNM1_9ACTO|nr:transcriptional repressor [Boudabousia liubingyangii]OKL49171.1 transcriptional repressor [Boudabousia liubingyangii]